ncbi:hypothetical protein ZHAS_00022008 [Anopheles sinensis]|uniref:Uncharacterized protein n=1 Tax=Anopheles sinensis TaxID=74873 RepID=A0A084WU80_ANOSI|nr:hypothetical protein ZHAS_00022008 [Anopheles sinensis]
MLFRFYGHNFDRNDSDLANNEEPMFPMDILPSALVDLEAVPLTAEEFSSETEGIGLENFLPALFYPRFIHATDR